MLDLFQFAKVFNEIRDTLEDNFKTFSHFILVKDENKTLCHFGAEKTEAQIKFLIGS